MNKKAFGEIFSESLRLKVHSVFHHVINLESNSGLISVVTPKIGRMSGYIVIAGYENENFISTGIKKDDRCFINNQELNIAGKLCIDFKGAALWQGVLDKGYKWKAYELKMNNFSALQSALNIYAVPHSAYRRIYDKKEKYLIEAAGKLKFCNSYNLIFSSVRELIGFGPGLTPTGDDLLTGFMSVITSCREKVIIRESISDCIRINSGRTGYISSNMLLNAAKGLFHEYIQDLIFAVTSGTPEEVMLCTKKN